MDEATFKRCSLDNRAKIRKSRCQIKPYGAAAETNLLPVLRSIEALTESKTKMAANKGGTQTAPLLSYNDRTDLGMIVVTNAISEESNQPEEKSNVKEILEEYKDRFEGIGKLKGIQVDLNVDPDFKPIAQPLRRVRTSAYVKKWRRKYNISWIKTSSKRLANQRDGCRHLLLLPRKIRAKYS